MTMSDIEKLESMVISLPDNGKLRLALGKAYLTENNHKRALEELEKAIEYEPTNPEAYLKLGTVLAEQKDFEQAIVNYRKALSLDSYYVEALYCLGMSYVDSNEKEEVEKIIIRLEQLHPVWAQGLKSYSAKIVQ